MIRYHARWVVPVSAPPIENATVVVEGARIAYVGPRANAPAGDDRDLGNVILTPGLVNAHTHLELTAMRGFLEDLPFNRWIVTLAKAKRSVLTPDMLLDAARLGLVEGVRAGITCYGDTCDSGVAARAMRERGVRGVMYQEVFGPDPAQCQASMEDLRDKVLALRAEETSLVRIGVSPHAPYTVSDDLFAAVARFALEDKLPVAVHIAESAIESEMVERGEGVFADGLRARGIAVAARASSPVGVLAKAGILDTRALLIHGVRFTASDIGAVARAQCPVAHCPASNAKLGHGIAPVSEMLEAGITVGLGSDSMASNNRMDVLEEARLAILMQRASHREHDTLSAQAAFELATIGGARALGFDDRIGTLEAGKDADLAAFSLEGPAAAGVTDPVGALVWALTGAAASLVCVAGQELMRDGRLMREDEGLQGRVNASRHALEAFRTLPEPPLVPTVGR